MVALCRTAGAMCRHCPLRHHAYHHNSSSPPPPWLSATHHTCQTQASRGVQQQNFVSSLQGSQAVRWCSLAFRACNIQTHARSSSGWRRTENCYFRNIFHSISLKFSLVVHHFRIPCLLRGPCWRDFIDRRHAGLGGVKDNSVFW